MAALRAASELRKKGCDLVIALSHQTWHRSKRLAEKVPGIDLVVSSHRIDVKTSSRMLGGTLLVGSGLRNTSFTEILVDRVKGQWEMTAVDRGEELLQLDDHPDFSRIKMEYKSVIKTELLKEKL